MKIIPIVFIALFLSIIIYLLFKKLRSNVSWRKPDVPFPDHWRNLLINNVTFYTNLPRDKKPLFEYKVHEFLINCKITGINTSVEELDKILIASSAVIPIFSFPEWQYITIDEVLLYPAEFDESFNTVGPDRNIAGLVGNGYMEGKMILSKSALHHGFENSSDKKNTAIHEFVHLIDKTDGTIDGVPEVLLDKQYVLPWLDLIHKKIIGIEEGSSNINPYGATNQAEFFAVISEYFFERPQLLKQKHPQLYSRLNQIFRQDNIFMRKRSLLKPRRNAPCPCGSGEKYKYCCGKK